MNNENRPTHPHLEGLIPRFMDELRKLADHDNADSTVGIMSDTWYASSSDLETALAFALAALPGGGVEDKPRLIGWRTDDYLMETADKAKAMNWQSHHRILPIWEGDAETKLPTPSPHEADRNA